MPGQSDKPLVFSHLFRERFDPIAKELITPRVTNAELADTITVLSGGGEISLQATNPANFLKDYLRSWSRNDLWPDDLVAEKYTVRQAYGHGAVFDFVPYAAGQTQPFPYEYDLPAEASIHEIEAITLPSAARALGRADESWLIQVCVHQRVLASHFAIYSDLDVIDLFHLQNTMKGTPEIDAVFLLTFKQARVIRKALVTLEAKRNDPILPDQIRFQAAYMAKQCRRRGRGLDDIDFIVPVAAATRSGQKHLIGIFEMRPIPVADGVAAYDAKTTHELPLVTSKAVGYTFIPKVTGI